MAPISQPFRSEVQKYFFQSDSNWFLPKRTSSLMCFGELSSRDHNEEGDRLAVFGCNFRLEDKILKVSKRCFVNTISNYLVAPLGFFYHGFFLAKKIYPIAIAKLLTPSEVLSIHETDKKELAQHLEGFIADSGNLFSTLATSCLLFTPLLKTVLVAFQETKDHQRSPLSLCKTFAPLIACVALATINLKRVYTDSQEHTRMPYWLRIKKLGLDLNQAKSLIAKHYLGLCDEDELFVKFNKHVEDNSFSIIFSRDDYLTEQTETEALRHFETKQRNWTQQDWFFQQLQVYHNDVMTLREEIKDHYDIELDTLLDVKLEMKRQLEISNERKQSNPKLDDKLVALKYIWETREVLVECVKHSYRLSWENSYDDFEEGKIEDFSILLSHLANPDSSTIDIRYSAMGELEKNVLKYSNDLQGLEAFSNRTSESLEAYKYLCDWATGSAEYGKDKISSHIVLSWLQNMSEGQIQRIFGSKNHSTQNLTTEIIREELLRLVRQIRGEDYNF